MHKNLLPMPNIALIRPFTEFGVIQPTSNQFQIAQKPANANIPEKLNSDSMPRKYDSFCEIFSLSSSGNIDFWGPYGFWIKCVWCILIWDISWNYCIFCSIEKNIYISLFIWAALGLYFDFTTTIKDNNISVSIFKLI